MISYLRSLILLIVLIQLPFQKIQPQLVPLTPLIIEKKKKTKLSRSHSHIVPSDHKNNLENTPQILFEKKWRCLAIYDTEFIHINRLFLPSLESVIHTNLPTNLKLPPEPEATTRNGLQRSDTKKRKE